MVGVSVLLRLWKMQYHFHSQILDSALLESLPAEMKNFATLLSSEQVRRVMQRVQDAYKGELLPGLAGALPSSAPTDYVQAHFVKPLKNLYTQTRSSAQPSPDSTGSKSAFPWIWETPDRRKKVKRETCSKQRRSGSVQRCF